MGTVESRPEPLIDHLRRVLSQPQGHRWRQFHLSDRKGWILAAPLLGPIKGWLPREKVLHLEITSLGALLWAQDTGKIFISLLLCNAIISLVLYLYTYSPYNLYTCLPYTGVSDPPVGKVVFFAQFFHVFQLCYMDAFVGASSHCRPCSELLLYAAEWWLL